MSLFVFYFCILSNFCLCLSSVADFWTLGPELQPQQNVTSCSPGRKAMGYGYMVWMRVMVIFRWPYFNLWDSSVQHLVKHAVDPILGSSTVFHIYHDAPHGYKGMKIPFFFFYFFFLPFRSFPSFFFFVPFSSFLFSLSFTPEYSISFNLLKVRLSPFCLIFGPEGQLFVFVTRLRRPTFMHHIYLVISTKACVVSIKFTRRAITILRSWGV